MHGLDPIDGGDKLPHEMAMEIAEASKPEETTEEPKEEKESSDEA